MFKIEDGREHFFQWDLNRRLIVEDSSINQVHFCNKTDDCSLVVEVYEENGLYLADVPNVLLQTDWKIKVYGYDKEYTKHCDVFKVEARTKPTDYAYTETEILNWSIIDKKVNDAIDEMEEIEKAAILALKNVTDATDRAIDAATGAINATNEAIAAEQARDAKFTGVYEDTVSVNEDATATLEEVKTALTDVTIATDNANAATTLATNATTRANEAADLANAGANKANDAATQAREATVNADDATTAAISATDDAVNATEEAIIATTGANEAANRANEVVTGINDKIANALKGNTKGEGVVITDISPVEHNVDTKLSRKNYFDEKLLSQVEGYNTYDESTGLWTTNNATNYSRSIFYNASGATANRDITKLVKVPKNKTITIKFYDFINPNPDSNDSNGEKRIAYAFFDSSGKVIGSQTLSSKDIVTLNTPDEECWLDIRRYFTSGVISFSKIQIEEGTVATPYTPYVDMADVTVKAYGKNLFDVFNQDYSIPSNRCSVEVLEDGTLRLTNRMVVQYTVASCRLPYTLYDFKGKTITLSLKVNCSNEDLYAGVIIRYLKEDGTSVGIKEKFNYGSSSISLTISPSETVTQTYKYIVLNFYTNASGVGIGSVGDYVDFENIQFEISDTATEYEPYIESTEYAVNEDGVVDGVKSIYPNITLLPTVSGVVIDAEYNRDINKAFAELQQAIISLGGNV